MKRVIIEMKKLRHLCIDVEWELRFGEDVHD